MRQYVPPSLNVQDLRQSYYPYAQPQLQGSWSWHPGLSRYYPPATALGPAAGYRVPGFNLTGLPAGVSAADIYQVPWWQQQTQPQMRQPPPQMPQSMGGLLGRYLAPAAATPGLLGILGGWRGWQ